MPKKIFKKDFPEEIDIRGEVFIQNSDFQVLKEKFANPRNAASGSLRQKNPDDTSKIPLKFIAYTFGHEKGLGIENQFEFLKNLNQWGFKTNPLNKLITGVKNLLINYKEIEKKRSEIDFDLGIDIDQGIAFDQQECEQRIRAQFQTLVAANIKYVILGAHGCGAFLNPTEKVAETYKKIIEDYKEHFNNISFAIFNAGYGPDNYTPFRRIISGVKKK